MDCVEGKSATSLLFLPGQQPTTEVVYADEVNDHIQVFLKCRALFSSIAYACIDMPDFFNYSDALHISDFILELIHKRHGGSRPPVSFLVTAYVSMMQHFTEEVRTNGRKLSAVTRCRNEWQQFWKMDSATVSSAQRPSQDSIEPSMKTELGNAQSLARSLRTELDQTRNQLKRKNQDQQQQHPSKRMLKRQRQEGRRDDPPRRDDRRNDDRRAA